MKLLVVVDMQNDFIDGALGTTEAQAIVADVKKRIEAYRAAGDKIIYTRDTHDQSYLDSQEGQKLPVKHCIRGTKGWEIRHELQPKPDEILDKPSFGSLELAEKIAKLNPESVELLGLCTDICVISNALILKARLPETPVQVNAACCAGVSPESHRNALAAMKQCQVTIIEEGVF